MVLPLVLLLVCFSIMAIPAIMAIMAISLDHVRSRADLSRRAVDHQITRSPDS
jgi:hypothetical protein